MKKILFSLFVFSFSLLAIAGANAQDSPFRILGADPGDWNKQSDWNTEWDSWKSFDSDEFDDFDDFDGFESGEHSRRKRAYRSHIGFMEVGFNGLRGSNDTFMELDMGRSLGWTWNFVHLAGRISRNNVLGFSMALGLRVNDYVMQTPVRVMLDSDDVLTPLHVRPADAAEKLKKSKLNTVAIHIPVALEFSPTRNFFISAGVYADLMIGSHFKSKLPKEKLRTAYTEFAQGGLTARIGWRGIYAFGNYGLTNLFDTDNGPEVQPFSLGIGLGF